MTARLLPTFSTKNKHGGSYPPPCPPVESPTQRYPHWGDARNLHWKNCPGKRIYEQRSIVSGRVFCRRSQGFRDHANHGIEPELRRGPSVGVELRTGRDHNRDSSPRFQGVQEFGRSRQKLTIRINRRSRRSCGHSLNRVRHKSASCLPWCAPGSAGPLQSRTWPSVALPQGGATD